MNYDYDVNLHGTWSRDDLQEYEANWFINRFKSPEGYGTGRYTALSDKEGRRVKRPFTTVTMTQNRGTRQSWVYMKRSGRFHIKLTVQAPTPTKALEVAEQKVRDYINKVTCNPPELKFL